MAGRPVGSLHGVPVGIKDIFDTFDMPTENGTILHAGRNPNEDATVVKLLRSAGAIIMGKTVTTELATYNPGKTKNPHNLECSPGGSSSGSAAAVAANMVPLAIGTQTNGSIIRPAAYCGVIGYKPTHGTISRHNVLHQSWHLDHVGVFARSIKDIALICEELMVFDKHDPSMRARAKRQLRKFVSQPPPASPRLAFIKSPVWHYAENKTKHDFEKFVDKLGTNVVEEVKLPTIFEEAVETHRIIMETDFATSFAKEYERGTSRLSKVLRKMIERGQKILAIEYNRAVEKIPVLNAAFENIFTKFDAILTPATTGEAPHNLESTGSPIFCTIWTLCGLPCISLPLLKGHTGLPVGIQLVGAFNDDERLLRTAEWLYRSQSRNEGHMT